MAQGTPMEYPKFWERLAAALIDWLLYTVFTLAVVGVVSQFAFGAVTGLRLVGFLAMILVVVLIVGYKVLFEAGRLQATPGKLVFGLRVVDANGGRPGLMPALLRTWPWWAFLITAITQVMLVGYWVNALVWLGLLGVLFTYLLPPGGRCLHDLTAGLYVVKDGPGMIGR
ncbi:MAG: RDD family protein [Alphaproteobacteria bacterium]